ncbi:hypothetical protein OAN307_c04920 [Octadecabacter antarcticus 307]|uniref:Uncharacterized protein n=1 Tax=Octadecabacter antarcticus 307 TaxID=391626 RepID=M9R8Z6_9RHOB|nr:hypothetical protein OAN307_c04920 [Octadecabacter antarcticus 307]
MVQAPRRVDVANPSTDDTLLSDMTDNVLAELGFQALGLSPPTARPSSNPRPISLQESKL